jgi:hypothetical protein
VKSIARIKDMAMVVVYSRTELIMKANGLMIFVPVKEVRWIETKINTAETF